MALELCLARARGGALVLGALLQDLSRSTLIFSPLDAPLAESWGVGGTCFSGGTGVVGELVQSDMGF